LIRDWQKGGELAPATFWSRATLLVSFAVLLLWSYRNLGAGRLEGRIIDDKTGWPLAAVVVITDNQGKAVEIDGKHAHVEYLAKRRCYVDGTFSLSGLSNRFEIEVRRGLETIPVKAEIDPVRTNSDEMTFRLKRWIDMKEEGYLSGDTHVHLLSTAESYLQMRAEDLNVLNLLVSDFTRDADKFTGKLDPVSTPGHAVYVGQEARDWQQGHVVLMRLKQIVQPFEPFGGTFEGRSEPNVVLARALRETRRQGGVTTWAHFCNLPGAESPIDIALGLVDAIDLITYDDPTQLPSHWGPWKNSGMSQAEFTVMRSMDLYYQYLNAGFRIPIAAGTDKMGENIPVGSNRLYARFGSDPTYDGWLAALKAGNGFVTNGPMLTFEVDGHRCGEEVEFSGKRRVRVRATARSILPFGSLEIVVNGETAALKTVTAQDSHPADGVFSVGIDTSLELDRSSWLAARVAEDPDSKQRILPRGLTVFAHSNPVYFLRDGVKVRGLPSIQYLEKYVKGTLHWLNTKARFTTASEKEEALRLAGEARQIYAGL
jgi:hypothetical protein